MQRITRDKVQYALSREHAPVARVVPGETIVIETHDCRTGTIGSEDQLADLADLRWVNPATGPIEVAGAVPGDILAIDIDAVSVLEQGLMIIRPAVSAFDRVSEPAIRIARVEGDEISIGRFRVALDPMVGVVGVAPAGPAVSTRLGGRHGGNMDTRLIAAGSRAYLTVEVPGANLYIGDVHAAMGDGEVFLTGVEIAADITVTIRLLRGVQLPTPMVETEEVLAIVDEGPSLDEAARRALDRAMDYLMAISGLSLTDAGFLLSAACHLRVSQFLPNASIHARVEIPKDVLRRNGWPTSPLASGAEILP